MEAPAQCIEKPSDEKQTPRSDYLRLCRGTMQAAARDALATPARHYKIRVCPAGCGSPRVTSFPVAGVPVLLTESEVQRSFRNLFKSKDVPPDTFDKAEALLDELRAESPLRHRLSLELEELRKMHTAKV
jgi:hypothetical protein